MKLTLLFLSRIGVLAFSYLFTIITFVQAQVTPDNTVGTTVEQSGNVSEINNGTVEGGNLFHSFQDFSVPTGNEAHFNNADSVDKIFSRVTGGNISDLDGVIRANGGADLYLINPAGIIFGENARLDVGGSFLGSTADSLLFPDDVAFSASDTQAQPVLTINAPIGLGFRDNPGDITVRAGDSSNILEVDNFRGLTVPRGNDITLFGGDINFDGSNILTIDGSVRLGSLNTAATVSLDENSSPTFPQDAARGNIVFDNSSKVVTLVDTESAGIDVTTKNLNVFSGSTLGVVTNPESNRENNTLTANISIDAAKTIDIDSNTNSNNDSEIFLISPDSKSANLGEININTTDLFLSNGGSINTENGADIIVNAANSIKIQNVNLASNSFSRISNIADTNDSGNTNINTSELLLNNGGQINTSTISQGNAGKLTIDANESVTITGLSETENKIRSGIDSRIGNGATGDTEGVTVNTTNLSLTNGGIISTTVLGQGNAGKLTINAAESVIVDGSAQGNIRSAIDSQVALDATGDTQGIAVNTANLSLTNGGTILNSVLGRGNTGKLTINADESVSLDNGQILSALENEGEGSVGGIEIVTKNFVSNKSEISTSTLGLGNSSDIDISANSVTIGDNSLIISSDSNATEGDAGSIKFQAANTIAIDSSYVVSQLTPNPNQEQNTGQGSAGNIKIQTHDLFLTNGANLNTSAAGEGNAGNIKIVATGIASFDGTSDGVPEDFGDTFLGDRLFFTTNISFDDRETSDFPSGVSSQAVEVEGSAITGDAGNIEIVADTFSVSNNAQVSVANSAQGNGGNVSVNADNITLERGVIVSSASQTIESSTPAETASISGGNISLAVEDNLTLSNQSIISAQANNNAQGGNINIDAGVIVAFSDGNNDIVASAVAGQGGNINIDATSVIGIEESPRSSLTNEINASSEVQGLDGNIFINTLNSQPAQRTIELASNIVVPETTSEQVCNANRELAAQNGLTIEGKGGIPAAPDLPLDSRVININGQTSETIDTIDSTGKENAIETAQGKITPARGIEVKNGEIILTSYTTRQDISGVERNFANCSV